MQVEIQPDETMTRKADEAGRINLGVEYADCEVSVVITEVSDE